MSDTLPPAIEAFVRAVNQGDLEAVLATFAGDALVNDQLHDHWGISQIRAWATSDIIGERLSLDIVSIVNHYGQAILTANVDGAFDKRGLPNPLTLAFHFCVRGDKIVGLIVLQNQSNS